MKPRTRMALLAGVAAMASSAATAQIVDDYGVEQPETGVTGVGVNDAAPPETVQEGGYIPPGEAERRVRNGTLDKDDLLPARPDGTAVMTDRREIAGDTRAGDTRDSAARLTAAQLDDADMVDSAGKELGEVEAVLLGPDGEPAAVLVELEDDVFGRERLIEIDLADLTTRPASKYRNIWSDRVDLVTDRPMDWFETAQDWNMDPRVSGASASR